MLFVIASAAKQPPPCHFEEGTTEKSVYRLWAPRSAVFVILLCVSKYFRIFSYEKPTTNPDFIFCANSRGTKRFSKHQT
jgi:hypothetical protein